MRIYNGYAYFTSLQVLLTLLIEMVVFGYMKYLYKSLVPNVYISSSF